MNSQDIIIAPATPPGEGGVAIIRLSGKGCLDLALDYFRASGSQTSPNSHVFYHGFIFDDSGSDVDEIMFVYMASPRSFTAEDVVEIHCHGGHQTVSKILQIFISAGARLAQPGEFSYRAFLNGRLDLSQAEAIADLIHARSDKARTLALSQLEGRLSQSLYKLKEQLKDILALIEAWLDFPEEELPQENIIQIRQQVESSIVQLQEMVSSYNTGRFYTEGVSLLILGKPNVGKSSLMNSLLGEERAIVTEIEGTTRDFLEEGLVINGLPVRLIDSAGVRDTLDPIEKEGVNRTLGKIKSSDLILLLFDGSQGFSSEDKAALDRCVHTNFLVLLTKADLPQRCILPDLPFEPLAISTKTGQGLDLLRKSIHGALIEADIQQEDSIFITNQRHQQAAISTTISLRRFLDALDQSFSLEFLAVDIREALNSLGQITGETTNDDILESIFSRFCIGK